MKFPQINSHGLFVLQTLRTRPMTIWQGIEAHGNFACSAKPEGIPPYKIVLLYNNLVEAGCLVKEGVLYRLSVHARHTLEKMDSKDQMFIGSVAMPRVNGSTGQFKPVDLASYSGRYVRL
jgi:hypothetical protein